LHSAAFETDPGGRPDGRSRLEPLWRNFLWILAVPRRDAKAQTLPFVTEPRDPIFPPMVGPGTGLVVAEVVPGVAVLAVILPDCTPLALAEIRSPETPRGPLFSHVEDSMLQPSGRVSSYVLQSSASSAIEGGVTLQAIHMIRYRNGTTVPCCSSTTRGVKKIAIQRRQGRIRGLHLKPIITPSAPSAS
jgi:hypothetical protein